MIIISIDPGWNGAVAMIENNKLVETKNCPKDRSEMKMADIIRNMVHSAYVDGEELEIYIEKVWSRPHQQGSFSFGKNFGVWLGIIAANKIVPTEVTPRVWQKVVGIRIPKDYKKRKDYFKRRAQKWVGKKHKITLANADAICLGMYVIERKKSE